MAIKKYLKIIGGALQKQLAFRARIVIWLLVDIGHIVILPFIWLAIMRESGDIQGFSPPDIITYYALIGLVSFITSSHSSSYIQQDILTGNLNKFLTKPVIYCARNYVSGLGYNIIAGSIGSVLIIALCFLFPAYVLMPASFGHTILFFCSLLVASILSSLIQQITGLSSFWLGDNKSVGQVRSILEKMFSGEFAPLTLYPVFMQSVGLILPFKYLYFIPISLYLGNMSLAEGMIELKNGIVWVLIFLIILTITWKRGLRKYEGSGA